MNDFTQGSILKRMIKFMIPILGALVLQAMYGAVDLMIVGQFGTTSGLSGISTGSNIMNLATFVVAGLAMAVTVQISKYIGMKNEERIARLLGFDAGTRRSVRSNSSVCAYLWCWILVDYSVQYDFFCI